MSSEKLTDYTVTLESNLAHYQKEPDSYSWKKQVDHLGPSGPRDSRAKPSGSLGPPWAQGIQEPKPTGSLGPPVAQGIQEQNQVDHLGTQWPKGFMNQRTQVFVAATSGNQITSGTDTVAEVILVP